MINIGMRPKQSASNIAGEAFNDNDYAISLLYSLDNKTEVYNAR